jgi:dTDP-4-dehydrorhamnose reductase
MLRRKKIYIAGCAGMLGEAFHHVFSKDYDLLCSDIDVNEDWISYLDFRDLDAYKSHVNVFKPDYLFHLGAYTDLEYCELNQYDTYITNTIAVENATYIANSLDIPLLYISTAGIFNGKQDIYDDWDVPSPLGHYARSKYAGEVFVEKNTNRHIICRAGWMMGGGPRKDKKFIQKIMLQIKEGKDELFVVNDKLGTPTYTHDFANNVKLLLEKEYWGLYNMVCGGITGRYEVASELVRILGLSDTVRITAVDSNYWIKEYFADRPPSERLVNKKLELRNINIMRDWRICLKEYIEHYYDGYLSK